MKENVIIRNERKEDWEIVETITRQAFYNLYVPGCVEHYLVTICENMKTLFQNWILFWS